MMFSTNINDVALSVAVYVVGCLATRLQNEDWGSFMSRGNDDCATFHPPPPVRQAPPTREFKNRCACYSSKRDVHVRSPSSRDSPCDATKQFTFASTGSKVETDVVLMSCPPNVSFLHLETPGFAQPR